MGYELWQEEHYARDFLLCLPNRHRDGIERLEAKYSDALALNRQLLRRLKLQGTESPGLLAPKTELFWAEHSERATLPSWADSTGQFPQHWLDLLGRWDAKRSLGYLRVFKTRVSAIQHTVVELVQKSEAPAVAVGETELLDKLMVFLVDKGLGELSVQRTLATVTLRCEDKEDAESVSTVGADVQGLAELTDTEYEQAVSGVAWPDFGPTPAPEECKLQVVEVEHVEAGWHAVSRHKRSGFKRLHKVGNCRLVPYRDCLVDLVEELETRPALYDSKCKLCFNVRKQALTSDSDFSTVSL